MKLTKFANLLALGLILTVGAVGCRKTPVGVTPLPGALTAQPKNPTPGEMLGTTTKPGPEEGVSSKPTTGTEGIPFTGLGHEGWIQDTNIFATDKVFFDFDSSVVKASERPKIAAVADYLKGHSADAVKVEGNCDERGTEEYNRALGERSALAVREELVRLGIDPTRVDTISYGKDRPLDPGHNEAAWRVNRRDDFVLLSPPK